MYLPLAGIVAVMIVGGAVILSRWPGLRRLAGIAACVIIIVQARMTWDRNEQYQTARAIWTDTVAKRPNNARARGNLAAIGSSKFGISRWIAARHVSPPGKPRAISTGPLRDPNFN